MQWCGDMAHSYPYGKVQFILHKQAFKDVLCLRFGCTPERLASHGRCGEVFSVANAFSCPNPVRDITALLLTAVCPNFGIESSLQPLTGMSFSLRSHQS